MTQRTELCRISQLGMERAADALSKLLRQTVTVEVADTWMSDCRQAEFSSDSYFGICMLVSGDINGSLLLALAESSAFWLCDQLLGRSEKRDLLAEPASSTLKEVGNILASSFLACLDDQLGLRAMPSPPQLCSAPLEKLLQSCLPHGDNAHLVIRTQLSGAFANDINQQGAIFLFPDPATLDKVLGQISSD